MDKKSLVSKLNLNSKQGGFAFSLNASVSVAISFIFSLIISIIVLLSGNSLTEVTNSSAVILISFLLGALICAVTLIIFYLKFKVDFKSFLICDKTKNNFAVYLATFLITFGVIFGLGELNSYFLQALEKIGLNPSSPTLPKFSVVNFILVTICVCVLPAVFEELLFRGVITYSLKEHGEVFAILVSGALFAIFHMQPAQTLYQFIFGALFAFIAIRSGCILPVIIAHFINNFFVVLNYYFLNLNFNDTVKIAITIIALIMLVVGVVIMLVFVKNEEPKKQNSTVTKLDFLKSAIIGLVVCLAMWLTNLV